MRALAIALASLLCVSAFAQEQPFTETLTVVRYLVDVRALDSYGHAISDLNAAEFSVKIAGKAAEVESATWVGSRPAVAAASPGSDAPAPAPGAEAGPGRLLVMFIQTDFGRSSARIMGQLKFNPLADRIVEMLGPNDRVAVLQHDSHLKLRLDFSRDRDAIRQAIYDSIRIERLPMPAAADGPSLVRNLDHEAMLRSASSETSLQLVADALREIPGNKLMLLAGWGLGSWFPGESLQFSRGWRRAMTTLRRDKVPIFSISTGLAGGQLMLGLVASSQVTGGVFAGSTHSFPDQTATRIAGAMAGYYELVLRATEPLPPGQHAIAIASGRRGIRVVAPPSIIVDPNEEAPVISYVDEPVDESKKEASALFAKAMAQLRNGEEAGVEKLLTAAIASDLTLARAWYERGMLAAARGDTEAATRDLRQYLELEPQGRHAAEVRSMLRGLD